jgi:hypothetical protein
MRRAQGRAKEMAMLRAPLAVLAVAMPLGVGCSRSSPAIAQTTAGKDVAASDMAERVSLVQLIADPEKYEGRSVRVMGFCVFQFEEQALFLHREDADQMNFANGLWLETSQQHADLNEAFIIAEGMFTAKEHGHLGGWPGSIRNITRLERVKSRADYDRIIRTLKQPGGSR